MRTNLKLHGPEAELSQPASQNQLLDNLLKLQSTGESFDSALTIVSLHTNQVLYEQGEEIEHIYFPLDAVVSNLGIVDDGTTVETAMVGREGIVGITAILDGRRHKHWSWVTIDGKAARIRAELLEKLFIEDEAALRLLLSYYRSLMTQVTQRCICNTRHTLLERLSCWLLMIHDRADSDDLRLTQEMMASRVSARRAGITVAAGVLQHMRAIECRRGKLHILDRNALEALVCECYSVMRLSPA